MQTLQGTVNGTQYVRGIESIGSDNDAELPPCLMEVVDEVKEAWQ